MLEKIIKLVKKPQLEAVYVCIKRFHVEHKRVVYSLFILLGFLILLAILHHNTNSLKNYERNQAKSTSVILTKVDDIQANLQLLATNPKNANATIAAISSDLATIAKATTGLAKASDIQKVSSQITSFQDDFHNQMAEVKRAMVNNGEEKQYLDAKILPFHVVSIDVLSGQPFVSINYVNHITPLTLGDSIAGWRIVAADYEAAVVEFKNDKDQYVKVALQG